MKKKKNQLRRKKRVKEGGKKRVKKGGEKVFVEQSMHYEKKGDSPQLPKEEQYKLPAGYGDHKIVLLVRDPFWIHAYWEINTGKVNELKKQIGEVSWKESRFALRIYDVTDIKFNGNNANRYFDITLTGKANNWYIHTGVPDRSYCVDIGVLTKDGRFHTIARSNTISTPRDTISPVIDEKWISAKDYEEIVRLSGDLQKGAGSGDISRLLHRRLQEEISSGAISSISSPAGRKQRK